MPGRILVIDDDRDFAESVAEALERKGFQCHVAFDEEQALRSLTSFQPEVGLVDLRLGGGKLGLDLIPLLREGVPHLECVVATAFGDMKTAIQAVKRGAFDYLRKPLDLSEVVDVLNRSLERVRQEKERAAGEERLSHSNLRLETASTRQQRLVRGFQHLASCMGASDLEHVVLREFVQVLLASEGWFLHLSEKQWVVTSRYRERDADQLPPGWADPLGPLLQQALSGQSPALVGPGDEGPPQGHSEEARYLVVPLTQRPGWAKGVVLARAPAFTREDLDLTEVLGAFVQETLRLKDTLKALKENEARLGGILELAGDAIVSIDQEQRILLFNRNAQRVFGYSEKEVLGQPINMLLPERFRRDHPAKVAGFVGTPRLMGDRQSVVGRRRDGEEFPATASISCLELGERAIYTAVVRDMSAAQRAQAELDHSRERLRQAQKMEALGKLCGGVAHDFNNMLMVVQGYADLAQKALSQGGPVDKVQSYLERIVQAADSAATVTAQLLTFSRRNPVLARTIELDRVVRDTLSLLARLVEREFALEVALNAEEARVRIDPGKLQQIVVNLVLNARDALRAGGTAVWVSTSLQEGTAASSKSCKSVVLRVRDDGCGMEEEVRSRLFEPFFSTKVRGKGTGLGLSTVYGIVQRAGGDISVESEPGLGSTFEVLLPSEEASHEPEAGEPDELRATPRQTGTVLLAEDEEPIREFVARQLRQRGYQVLEARDGREALSLGQEHPYDLLLTDLCMPRLGGVELAKRLKPLGGVCRVLFMTGNPTHESLERLPGDCLRPLLTKPFSGGQLLDAVGRALQNVPCPPARSRRPKSS